MGLPSLLRLPSCILLATLPILTSLSAQPSPHTSSLAIAIHLQHSIQETILELRITSRQDEHRRHAGANSCWAIPSHDICFIIPIGALFAPTLAFDHPCHINTAPAATSTASLGAQHAPTHTYDASTTLFATFTPTRPATPHRLVVVNQLVHSGFG